MFKAYDKDQNITFVGETTPRLEDKILSVTVSSNADVTPLQTADRIDVFENDSDERLVASYKIVGWKAVERLWDGIRITWQTYSEDELNAMQEQLEETNKALERAKDALFQYELKIKTLTKAILDLASVVGKPSEPTYGGEEPEEKEVPAEATVTEEHPVETAVTEEKPKRRRRKKAEDENG